MNTTDFLNIAVSICPSRPAIAFEGKRFTYTDLGERVNRLANALSKLGISKGDRVATLQVNCNQLVEIYFASARIGAIYVPLNFRAKGDELTYLLNDAGVKTLFVGSRYINLVQSILSSLSYTPLFISLEHKQKGMLYYEDVVSSAPTGEIATEIGDEDPTMLLYTAGTTGVPKGVRLSHKSFAIYMLENVTPADPEIAEVTLISVPLYHVAGIQAMLAAVYGGRTIVVERQFEPEEWMKLVESERVARVMMVPTMLKQIIDHPNFSKFNLSSIKVITYGAAAMPLEVITRAVSIFPGVSFINAFGQTETASTVTVLGPEDHKIEGSEEEKAKKIKRLSSSIGKPLPDVEMKVFDENGRELPVGKVGEIVVRGPRVMNEYWKGGKFASSAIDQDGWAHTRDMGYVDEDGYFYLAGRTSDLIIRGGENIYPAEIENVLNTHPKVIESAVIGVPDAEWGEVPIAVVILKPGEPATEEEIMEYCRLKIASYKRPRAVFFADEFPRNNMGKVLKRELRQKYADK